MKSEDRHGERNVAPAHERPDDFRKEGDAAMGEEEVCAVGKEAGVSDPLDRGDVDGAVIDAIVIPLCDDGEQREEKKNGSARNGTLKTHAIKSCVWDAAICEFIAAPFSILLTKNCCIAR